MDLLSIFDQINSILIGLCGVFFSIGLIMAALLKFSSGFNEQWGEKGKQVLIACMIGGFIFALIPTMSSFFGF